MLNNTTLIALILLLCSDGEMNNTQLLLIIALLFANSDGNSSNYRPLCNQ